MKKSKSLLLSISFLFLSSHVAWAENISISACAKHPVFIQPINDKEGQVIWETIVKTAGLEKTREFFNTESFLTLFKADINNDGITEYIAVIYDTTGTMGLQSVLAFRKEDGKFIPLDEPPKPANAGDGYWYSHISNPFLTQLCGKTYMTFIDPISDGVSYIWEKSTTHEACDSEWIVYQRDKSNKLYQTGNYNSALTQLNLYINACDIFSLSNNSLWMLNDAAFYAFKAGKISTCLTLLNKIKTHPQYAHITPALKKAVESNDSLCKLQEKKSITLNAPHGKEAYHWLLDKTPYSPTKINELLVNTIPETWEPNQNKDEYAEIVDFNLFDFEPEIIYNRYALLKRGWPHSQGDIAFIWVDVNNGTSIIGRSLYTPYNDTLFSITSKNFNADTVPFAAKQAILKDFDYTEYNSSDKKIIFYDWTANKNIILPFSWLMER